MFPKEIEMILARQLAGWLAVPVLLVDPAGTLIYFNEQAEATLGRRFEETGELTAKEWLAILEPTNREGAPLPAEALPVSAALATRRPATCRCWIKGQDEKPHELDVIALPVIGQADRYLGLIVLLWGTDGA